MKIQITLYDSERKIRLTRHVVDVPKEGWEAMSFSEKEKYCKRKIKKTLFWHWRELEKNEA